VAVFNFKSIWFKVVGIFLSLCLVLPVYPQSSQVAVSHIDLLSTSEKADLPKLIGIKVYEGNPLKFDFILDEGSSDLSQEVLQSETNKLIRYFLAALTVPEKDLWVNLSPNEQNRIIPQALGQTDMGRDMLSEDYLLKRLAASLTYPETTAGKKYWDEMHSQSLNRVWVVPGSSTIYQDQYRAFITDAKLRVMTEEDYLNKSKNSINSFKTNILPLIEKDINQGKNFSELRQMYKSALKESIISQLYSDKNKLAGVDIKDPTVKEKIYQKYLEAFKRGAYNYVKHESVGAVREPPLQRRITKRAYFSGGMAFKGALAVADKQPYRLPVIDQRLASGNCRRVEVSLKPEQKGKNIIDPSDLSTGRLLVDKINQVKQQAHVQTDTASQELYDNLTATGEEILRAHYPYLNETGKARHAQIRKLTKSMRADGFTWSEETFQELKGLLNSIPTVDNFCFDLTVDVFDGENIDSDRFNKLFGKKRHEGYGRLFTFQMSVRCNSPCAFCQRGKHSTRTFHAPFIMAMKLLKYINSNRFDSSQIMPYSQSNIYDYRDDTTNATFADILRGMRKLGILPSKAFTLVTTAMSFDEPQRMLTVNAQVDVQVDISLHTMHENITKRCIVPFYKGKIGLEIVKERLAVFKNEYLSQYRKIILERINKTPGNFRIRAMLHSPPFIPQRLEGDRRVEYKKIWEKYPKAREALVLLGEFQDEIILTLKSEFTFSKDDVEKIPEEGDPVGFNDLLPVLKPGVDGMVFQKEGVSMITKYIDELSRKAGGDITPQAIYDFVDFLKTNFKVNVSLADLWRVIVFLWDNEVVYKSFLSFRDKNSSDIVLVSELRNKLAISVASAFFLRNSSWWESDYLHLQGSWAQHLIDDFRMEEKDVWQLIELVGIRGRNQSIFGIDSHTVMHEDGRVVLTCAETLDQRFRSGREIFDNPNSAEFRRFVKLMQIVSQEKPTLFFDDDRYYAFHVQYNEMYKEFLSGPTPPDVSSVIAVVVQYEYLCALREGYFSHGQLQKLVGNPDSTPDYATIYEAFKNIPIPLFWKIYIGKLQSQEDTFRWRENNEEAVEQNASRYSLISSKHKAYPVNIRSAANEFPLPINTWVAGPEFVEEPQTPGSVISVPFGTAVSDGAQLAKGGVDWQAASSSVKFEGTRAQFSIPIDNVAIDPKTFCGFSGKIMAMETIDRED
jgi:hypothetical protein